MKRLFAFILVFTLLTTSVYGAELLNVSDIGDFDETSFASVAVTTPMDVSAKSAIVMEKETGEIIFEKNPDERLPPASVTKIMTILLIVEALNHGEISLTDTVTASENASSMGGSQIFLKQNETMTVEDMLKSIVVSSANDAAVAMAEYMAGTEDAFVSMMNDRAKELNMDNTNFTNCTGLMDDDNHYTTARDIAIMSRELISYDFIKQYTTIWMDTIREGEFGLSNTNKLIRFYSGATGLKTGFTDKAMFCLSATAQREDVEFISVILHAPTSKERFNDAKALLDYAFANYTIADNSPDSVIAPVKIKLGKKETIQPILEVQEKILIEKSSANTLEKIVDMPEIITAPVQKGQKIGTVTIKNGDNIIKTYSIVSSEDVKKVSIFNIFAYFLKSLYI